MGLTLRVLCLLNFWSVTADWVGQSCLALSAEETGTLLDCECSDKGTHSSFRFGQCTGIHLDSKNQVLSLGISPHHTPPKVLC